MPISGNKYVTPAWVNDSRTGPFINAAEMLAIGRQLELANVGFDVESKDVLPAAQGHLDKTIAFGNGRAVSVGYNNDHAGMYSDDGETWTAFTDENLPLRCTGLVYGGGYFVAVGNGGNEDKNIAYSEDGVTWFQADLVWSAGWAAIAYGAGVYVVIHKSGISYYANSPSGPWTAATPGDVNTSWNFCGLAYKDGVFVAVESSLGKTKRSTDKGASWTDGTINITGATTMSIAAGNGLFVVIADLSSFCAYSRDGVTWSSGQLNRSRNWASIAFGNGRFLAVSANSAWETSTDGETWTVVNPPDGILRSCCAFIFGRFAVFASGSTAFVLAGSVLAKRIAEALGIDQTGADDEEALSCEVITRQGTNNVLFTVGLSDVPKLLFYFSDKVPDVNVGSILIYVPGINRAYEIIPDVDTGALSIQVITAVYGTVWMTGTTLNVRPTTGTVLNWHNINYYSSTYEVIALY